MDLTIVQLHHHDNQLELMKYLFKATRPLEGSDCTLINCCLMPGEQFCGYIKAKTGYLCYYYNNVRFVQINALS